MQVKIIYYFATKADFTYYVSGEEINLSSIVLYACMPVYM